MKNEVLRVRLEQEDKENLTEFSTTLDIPVSQIVREAIREKIAVLRRTHPQLQPANSQIALDK